MAQDGPNLSPINTASTLVSNTFQVQTGSPDSILATVDNPFPFGINAPPRRNVDPPFFYGKLIVARKPAYPLPHVQQWNIAIERQVGNTSSLMLAYAGSKGTNLLLQGFATVSNINLNHISDKYFSMGSAVGTGAQEEGTTARLRCRSPRQGGLHAQAATRLADPRAAASDLRVIAMGDRTRRAAAWHAGEMLQASHRLQPRQEWERIKRVRDAKAMQDGFIENKGLLEQA